MSAIHTLVGNGNIYRSGWISGGGEKLAVTDPASGEVLMQIDSASQTDVDEAAAAARAAQRLWAAAPFNIRAEKLRRIAGLLQQQSDRFRFWNAYECGAIAAKADWELNASCEQAWMCAAMPMQAEERIYPSLLPGRRNRWRRVPLGVVGVISPWNFPILLTLRSVLPALAVGNAVIIKPDEKSSLCGGLLLAEVMEEAGLPAGLVHVLPGGPEIGAAIVSHPQVDMIAFTGSTEVGRQIGETCGRMLKKCALELGGNNALVVMDDADLESATSCGAWGAFLHQGQICMQTGRHLVQRAVAGRYAERLTQRALQLKVDHPAQPDSLIGPLISATQAARVEQIVAESLDMGARALTGGKRNGNFYPPTVLTGVTPEMPVFTQEIFGPVAPVVAFDTVEEAIDLVNATSYGLTAAIQTQNRQTAERFADQVRCGMVHINDQTVNNEFHVPFGGMGASGNGSRFGGEANFDEFTQMQWVSEMPQGICYPF